jgi:chromosome segregation ATPase
MSQYAEYEAMVKKRKDRAAEKAKKDAELVEKNGLIKELMDKMSLTNLDVNNKAHEHKEYISKQLTARLQDSKKLEELGAQYKQLISEKLRLAQDNNQLAVKYNDMQAKLNQVNEALKQCTSDKSSMQSCDSDLLLGVFDQDWDI